MRILVTGGAGYIGSHTAQALLVAGHAPVVFDDLSMGHREFAKFGPFEFGSVLDTARLTEVLQSHQIEAVVHCAAKALVSEAVQAPERYLHINVGGTAALLTAMKMANVTRLVFSSSAAVYGDGSGKPLRENDPTQPVNAYGLSKLQAEQVIAAVAPTFELKWAALRFFNVVGSDSAHDLHEWHVPETHLVPNLFTAARERLAFKLFGTDYPTKDGTAVRDYVDVQDLAGVHVEALQALERDPSFISNVGRGAGYSVKEVVDAATQAWDLPIVVNEQPRRAGDPAFLVADNTFLLKWSETARRGFRPLQLSLKSVNV